MILIRRHKDDMNGQKKTAGLERRRRKGREGKGGGGWGIVLGT